MATYSRDLEKQMQQYIDAEETASLELRKLLQSTTAEIRYKLLMEVRGVKYRATTGVFNAAYIRDLPGAKCMLDGMSEEQKFNTLKIAYSNDLTPLHSAVSVHNDHPYSSEVAKELTNNLSAEQLYQLLEMKTKESESTVLHFAVYCNRVDFVPRILAQLTWDQKNKLLSIRNAAGATPADLSVTTIFSTVQVVAEQKNELAVQKNELAVQKNELAVQKNELAVQKNELAVQKNELAVQKNELAVQKNELAVQKNELAVQKNELAEQKNELAEQGKGLREAQQTIETVNGELVIQGTVQSQLSDRCKELEAERAQELKETKKALVDLQTTSDVEKEKLQKTILQMEQNVLKQTEELKQAHENVKTLQEEFTEQKEMQLQVVARCTELEIQKVQQEEVVAEQTRELNVQKNQLFEQDKAIEQTNKVLTDLQQSSKEHIKALENQIILQTEVIVGQKKEISQHGQTQQILLDKCAELERQKQEQGEVITEQTRELNEQKNKVMEQQNQLVEQGRALQDTRDELDRLQEKNDEQEQVIQVMSARQAAMEQMLERLDLEFRRPIVTDETGDQENEDY